MVDIGMNQALAILSDIQRELKEEEPIDGYIYRFGGTLYEPTIEILEQMNLKVVRQRWLYGWSWLIIFPQDFEMPIDLSNLR